MAKKRSVSTIYLTLTLVLSTLIVIMVGATMVFLDTRQHNEMVEKTSERISNQLKESMIARVKRSSTLIGQVHQNAEEYLKDKLAKRVREAHKQASFILSKNADLPLSTQKDLITETLRPIRFNFDRSAINIMDIYGEIQLLPGNIRYEGHKLQDLNLEPKERLQQLKTVINQVRKDGELYVDGYNSIAFDNKHTETRPRIGFFKYLEPLNWIIGTSESLEAFEKDTKGRFLSIVEPLENKQLVKFFIADYNLNLLIAPNKEVAQKEVQPNQTVMHVLSENNELLSKAIALAKANKSEVITANWFNQKTKQYEPILLYLEVSPPWKWIIGTFVTLSNIDKEIGLNKARLTDRAENEITKISAILIVAYAITLIAALFIYRKVNWHFNLFINHLQHAAHDNLPVEKDSISIKEFDLLAHTMNEQLKKRLELQHKLERLAQKDPLTDLYNRRRMDELLNIEKSRVERNNNQFSLILCDIDHFKQVNDTYGHETGDKVIIAVADILKQSLRQQDFISRWGGEEFLIALPDTDINQAIIVAEKIRTSCENTIVSNAGHNVHFTMTLGIDVFDNSKDIKATIAAADAALYEGKQTGRNLVICFKEL
jgi:diguanylate cyclase (GGDEF)-like protein